MNPVASGTMGTPGQAAPLVEPPLPAELLEPVEPPPPVDPLDPLDPLELPELVALVEPPEPPELVDPTVAELVDVDASAPPLPWPRCRRCTPPWR